MVKTRYDIGDTVWVYGIYVSNEVPCQGKIVHCFNLNFEGFDPTVDHYVIAVDSHIEPLIEVRTWETISQDEHGPVGGLRGLGNTADSKILARTGINLWPSSTNSEDDDDLDPTPDQIHAAMERSKQTAVLPPLFAKEFKKPKPRNFHKKRNRPQ
jgi:hypothetical protein